MKRSEFIKAVNDSKEAAEYNRFIDNMTSQGRAQPGRFTKRQAADLKAGYGDGLVQGALIGLEALGIKLEEG